MCAPCARRRPPGNPTFVWPTRPCRGGCAWKEAGDSGEADSHSRFYYACGKKERLERRAVGGRKQMPDSADRQADSVVTKGQALGDKDKKGFRGAF